MARIRTIKPEFPQSESMGRISRDARLCFIMLWTLVDDEGRARASSRMLASLLFPYDDDAPKLMEGWLCELEQENCIIRYMIDGHTYLEIPKWLEHQRIDKPSKSKFPQFVEHSRIFAKPREPSCLDLDLDQDQERDLDRDLTCGRERERRREETDEFKKFYNDFPHKVGRPKAAQAYSAALKRGATPGEIENGLRLYISNKPPDRQWLNPATFLNQDRFRDMPASVGVKHSHKAEGIWNAFERVEAHFSTEDSFNDANGIGKDVKFIESRS